MEIEYAANWVQMVENNLDGSHIFVLHRLLHRYWLPVAQDTMVSESQGRTSAREAWHLGTRDATVVMFDRLI